MCSFNANVQFQETRILVSSGCAVKKSKAAQKHVLRKSREKLKVAVESVPGWRNKARHQKRRGSSATVDGQASLPLLVSHGQQFNGRHPQIPASARVQLT